MKKALTIRFKGKTSLNVFFARGEDDYEVVDFFAGEDCYDVIFLKENDKMVDMRFADGTVAYNVPRRLFEITTY